MSRVVVDLSPGQLHKLAEIIHLREVEKLNELKFESYEEQLKYLNDAKDARDKVYHILENTQEMLAQSVAENDATKQEIAKNVYDYCTYGIGISLKFVRSYNTRLTYLDKLKSHSDELIKRLRLLNPSTKEAQRMALEAGMYKKATLEYAKKFQHIIPNQFTKYLKENQIKFEDLVQRNMAKLGFSGPFKNLDDIKKLQVYENIIEEAGYGKSGVTHSFEALEKGGVAFLVFTAAVMVWDIYTADDVLRTAMRDLAHALIAAANVFVIEDIADKFATAAVRAGVAFIEDIEIRTAVVTIMGSVLGFGIATLIGFAAGELVDMIFSSGTTKVTIKREHYTCRVAAMPDSIELARLVKYNYPDL